VRARGRACACVRVEKETRHALREASKASNATQPSSHLRLSPLPDELANLKTGNAAQQIVKFTVPHIMGKPADQDGANIVLLCFVIVSWFVVWCDRRCLWLYADC